MKKILFIVLVVLLAIACNNTVKEKIKLIPYGESEFTQGSIDLVIDEIFEFTIANSSIDTYIKVEDFRVAELNSYLDESGQKVYVISPNYQGKTYLTITDYKEEIKLEINVKIMTISCQLDFNKKQSSGILEIKPLVNNLPKNCDKFLMVLGNNDTNKVLDLKFFDKEQLEKYQSEELSEVMFIDTFDLHKRNQGARNYELNLFALPSEIILPGKYSYSSLIELLDENSIFSCMTEFSYILAVE